MTPDLKRSFPSFSVSDLAIINLLKVTIGLLRTTLPPDMGAAHGALASVRWPLSCVWGTIFFCLFFCCCCLWFFFCFFFVLFFYSHATYHSSPTRGIRGFCVVWLFFVCCCCVFFFFVFGFVADQEAHRRGG